MKAILVIDYASEEDIGEKTSIHLINKKNKWYEEVVIKPMPSRQDNDSEMVGCLQMDIGYTLGWNACLDELLNTGLNYSKEGEELEE